MKCTFSYLTELIDRSVSSGVFLNSKSMFNSSLFLAMETTELLQLWPSGGEVTTPHWGRQQRGRLMWTSRCWGLTRASTPLSQRDARLWSRQIFTKISFKLPYPRFLHWDLRINPYLRRILQKSATAASKCKFYWRRSRGKANQSCIWRIVLYKLSLVP